MFELHCSIISADEIEIESQTCVQHMINMQPTSNSSFMMSSLMSAWSCCPSLKHAHIAPTSVKRIGEETQIQTEVGWGD